MKATKLYKVEIGYIDGEIGECTNWRSVNVLAKDAAEAIGKPKLNKRMKEYVVAVEVVGTVDE